MHVFTIAEFYYESLHLAAITSCKKNSDVARWVIILFKLHMKVFAELGPLEKRLVDTKKKTNTTLDRDSS